MLLIFECVISGRIDLDNKGAFIVKTVVIYKSKSGYVKNYAEWISEALDADLYDLDEITEDKLYEYDTIIYGGGLYAVGINGLQKIMKHFDNMKYKNIVLFMSGASPGRPEILEEVVAKNLSEEQQKIIKSFYLRGGFEYDRLGFVDKRMMDMMKMKLKRKKNPTPDDRGMLAAYDTPVDFTRKENISELVEYVKSLV